MKLTLGFTAALLACAVTAHAQAPSVGVRVGVNLADLAISDESDEDEIVDSKTLTAFVGGLFVVVPANNVVAFQPELLFSMQGTRFSEDGQTAKIKLDYVQVPLLGRFRLGSGSPVAVLVGPSLGFRYRAKLDVPGAPPGFDDEFEDGFETFDIGLVTGVTADIGHLVLDGRYTWGLSNVVKETEFVTGSGKNRVFSASVGFRF